MRKKWHATDCWSHRLQRTEERRTLAEEVYCNKVSRKQEEIFEKKYKYNKISTVIS